MTSNKSRPWVLDGCAIINLAAALPIGQLHSLMRRRVFAVRQAAVEVLYLHDVIDGARVRQPVDLAGLEIDDLRSSELADFVAFARGVDDGEAATLAVAKGRSFVAVTDDLAARKAVGRTAPSLEVIGTAAAMRHFAETNGVTKEDAGNRLLAIEQRARFAPRADDPDRSWWRSCVALVG
jgi:predicted nucleic acid-binding protein